MQPFRKKSKIERASFYFGILRARTYLQGLGTGTYYNTIGVFAFTYKPNIFCVVTAEPIRRTKKHIK